MITRKRTLCTIAALLSLSTGPARGGSSDEVDGVLSLTPVGERSYIAVELRVASGQRVIGLRWFNNDGLVPFPEVAVVEVQPEAPPSLTDRLASQSAVLRAANSWVEVTFEGPVMPSGGTLYALFRLPPFAERSGKGAGGGAAVGYRTREGGSAAYLSADGEEWVRVSPKLSLAIEPIVASATGFATLSGRAAPGAVAADGSLSFPTALGSVYPNPANPAVTIAFSLAALSDISLSVYDLRGALVRTLVRGPAAPGEHVVEWRGVDDRGVTVASGIYVVRLDVGGKVMTKRMTLVR